MPINNVVEFNYSGAAHRIGQEIIEPGMKLYAIYNNMSKRYFIWAYTNKAFADHIAKKVLVEGDKDLATNWRVGLNQLSVSTRTS